MPRFPQRLFSIATLCILALFCLAAAPLYARRAPDPSFKDLAGQTRKLSALRGEIVVMNFWATWCGPCQEELPRLAKMAADYSGKPVSFVRISIDAPKDRAKIPGVLERLHVPPESWVGADTDMLDRFGLGDIVPGTAILDEKGEIVARIRGGSTGRGRPAGRGLAAWGKAGAPAAGIDEAVLSRGVLQGLMS